MIRVLLFIALHFLGFIPCATADEVWRPVDVRQLSILPGSILDFSPAVAGARSNKKKRLLCASQPYGIEEGFPDHATADAYAKQLRLHGYNMARFHFVDTVLMTGRLRDFDFNQTQVDRFHYFLSALKREGVAWMMDGLTSSNAAYGDVGGDRWTSKRNVKAGIYYDVAQQEHWKELVKRILAVRNPYTGLRILDDPALYGVVLVNEGGLNHIVNLKPDPWLDLLFSQWVLKRYGTVESARKSWGMAALPGDRITLPRKVWTATPLVKDAQRFYYDSQNETLRWMTEYMRTLGYAGLVTAFNNWPNLQDQATRAHLPWVAFNAYHEEPTDFVRLGSSLSQNSSLVNGLAYVRSMASSRYWGKPFTVSEHGHPFWNRWRYESGLAVGAYAALQDWDLICRHGSGPVELAYGSGKSDRRKAIYPYGIGMDPIERANETLTALLYLRGDVSPANHRIGIRLSEDYVFEKGGGIGHLPEAATRLGLVTGIGLVWEDQKPALPLDSIFEPAIKQPTLANKLAEKVGLTGEPSFPEILSNLQKRDLLQGNKSDGKSTFISDTGEILLEPLAKSLKVITPRTEAVAFERAPGKLNTLTISQATVPALFAASSMDGRSLETSGRVLLIVATDARNSGMRFADTDERELLSLGSLPVMLRVVHLTARLRHSEPEKLTLYALSLNGERTERLPLTIATDGVTFTIDTASLKHGPTTYFELAIE